MDFTVSHHGSIYLLEPHTTAALGWIDQHLPAVEHRYIRDIVSGIRADGLGVR